MKHSYETIMEMLSDLFGKTCAPFQLRYPPRFTVPDYLGQKIYEANRNEVRYTPSSIEITIDGEADFRMPSKMKVQFSIGKSLMFCELSYRKETTSGEVPLPEPRIIGKTDGQHLTLRVPCPR